MNGQKFENPALIRRVRDPFGILGNMSRHPVVCEGLRWRTTEALFQALRFPMDSPIREQIRAEKNPMKAKFAAKGNVDKMCIDQLGPDDLDNMRLCLRLKYDAHKDVREVLESTKGRRIVEDCTRRQRGSGLFWGAALREDGLWHGENWLGRLWEEIRNET